MALNEEKIKQNFAKNLVYHRKKSGLTQLQLAEKLNYTDKSISKWERGDGLPDLCMTAAIAEYFGITVDDLLSDKPVKRPATVHNKIITTILACGMAWLVAVVLFFFFTILIPDVFSQWLFFIYALPATAIVLIVFSSIWWSKLLRFFSVSMLIWTIPLSIVLSVKIEKISLMFIISAVLQVLTIFFFLIKKNSD